MKPTGTTDSNSERRGTAVFKLTCAVALVLVSINASSFLYAIHTKSETDEKNRRVHDAKIGKLGEIDRGPHGTNEIALTFDGGAEVDCFEDLIAALETAHVKSTFFITGRFTQAHADCAAEITKRGHEIGNHTLEPSQFN